MRKLLKWPWGYCIFVQHPWHTKLPMFKKKRRSRLATYARPRFQVKVRTKKKYLLRPCINVLGRPNIVSDAQIKKFDRQWVGLLAKQPRFVLSCNWLTTLVALFRWNLRTLFGRSSFAHIGMVLLFDDHPVVWTQHNFWFSADSRESVACLDDPYFLYGLSNLLVGYDEIL